MTGAMPTAQYLLSAILALLPSPHLQESLEALLLLLLQGHGKARPQHSQTKSPARCFPHGKAAAPQWPGTATKAHTAGCSFYG